MAKFYTNVLLRKDNIFLRGFENGKRIQQKIPYKPYLFIQSDKPSKYRTIEGKPVSKMDFDSVTDAKKFFEEYKDVGGMNIYGFNNFLYMFIYDNYKGEIKYDPSLINVVTIDIEVASDAGFPDIQKAQNPITAITVRCRGESYIFGCGDFTSDDEKVHYFKCKDEHKIINNFLQCWEALNPDIVTGWNVEFFDVPFLVNRISNLFDEKEANRLSPWRILEERSVEINGRPNQVYLPAGVTVLDYLQLYKKFTFGNQESYRLDHIANVELGERKIDYSEYESLLDLYKKDYQKFIEYNIHDCILVDKLDEKLGFINQVFALAYDAKVNYNDTLTTVKPWDVIIHNFLMERSIVIPQFKKSDTDETIMGGHVKEPKPGLYRWVVSFDLNSLYPHLIMQYNISPDTFAGKMPDNLTVDNFLSGEFDGGDVNYSYAANGTYYRKDKQGFLAELMEKMYNDRTVYKKKMIEAKKKYEETKDPELQKDISRFHNMQMAKKIQLNSAYGALANLYFRWFDNNLAEAITSSGQLSIRWIEQKMNLFMNKLLKTKEVDYVIASDTDSLYIDMSEVVQAIFGGEDGGPDEKVIVDALDKFIEAKIQPYMDKSYQELADMMNAYQQKMQMKRECIANKGIWTAKKRYILNVWNQEGVQYDKPKLKMQGIEAVRSSTPMSVRSNIKEALQVIMNKDQQAMIEFINMTREKFKTLPFEEIAFPRGCKGLDKYIDSSSIYKKGTPIQVKAALIYNYMLDKKGLKKYPKIHEGDKIKFSYLKMPNPIYDTVIATPGALPKQFGLDDFIDYDMQFDKAFLEPIKTILDAIGWQTEKKASLEDLFS